MIFFYCLALSFILISFSLAPVLTRLFILYISRAFFFNSNTHDNPLHSFSVCESRFAMKVSLWALSRRFEWRSYIKLHIFRRCQSSCLLLLLSLLASCCSNSWCVAAFCSFLTNVWMINTNSGLNYIYYSSSWLYIFICCHYNCHAFSFSLSFFMFWTLQVRSKECYI